MRLKSNPKRIISLALAGCMAVSMVPASAVTVFAEETGMGSSITAPNASETVAVTVTVSGSGQLENAVKAAALKQGITDPTTITELTVVGGPLDTADWEYLSGIHVEGAITSGDCAKALADDAYLSGLKKVNLKNATCVDDTIPARSFCKSKSIEIFVLPDTLQSIGPFALSWMPELQYVGTDENGSAGGDVCFPDSLNTIGDSAFWGDAKITGTLILPTKEYFGMGCGAFGETSVKGELTIGNHMQFLPSVKDMSHRLKFKSTQISKVSYDNTITEVQREDFYECPITSIQFSDSIKKIGTKAFFHEENSNQIKTFDAPLVIPQNVTEIEAQAFVRAGKIESVIVENPDIILGNECFKELSSDDCTPKVYFASLPSNVNNVCGWNNKSTIILNMDGGKIDTSKLAESDKNATTKLYTPEKKGYTFEGWYNSKNQKITAEPTASATSSENIYIAHWTQNGETAILSTNMENKQYTVGEEQSFSFTTLVTGTNSGKTVKAVTTFNSAKDSIVDNGLRYLEKTTTDSTGTWKTFDGTSFGPAQGFPLTNNLTSDFKVTFKKAGTYNFNVAMKQVNDDGSLGNTVCEKDVTIVVDPITKILTLPENVKASIDGKDVSYMIQGKKLEVDVADIEKGTGVTLTVSNPDDNYDYTWKVGDDEQSGISYTVNVKNADVNIEVTSSKLFDIVLPGDESHNVIYDGKAHTAEIARDSYAESENFEVKYYSEDGKEVAEPTEVGTYEVKIIAGKKTIDAGTFSIVRLSMDATVTENGESKESYKANEPVRVTMKVTPDDVDTFKQNILYLTYGDEVEKVELNGHKLTEKQYKISDLLDMMNAAVSQVATYAMEPETLSIPLDVTYKTAGTHAFKMEVKNAEGALICQDSVNVTIAEEQKPDDGKKDDTKPENPVTTYALTVADGTVKVNGKDATASESGAYAVEKDAKVEVTFDKTTLSDAQVFDQWTITPASVLNEVDPKSETISFTMPAEEVSIKAMTRDATIEDDGPGVLGTAAMIGVGVAGTAVLGYQGYMIGTELYLNSVLPAGAAIPTNTAELAKLVWTDAGKPAPAAVLATDATDEQKALTWAVENQLISADKAADASVTRWEVIQTWNQEQEMKKV